MMCSSIQSRDRLDWDAMRVWCHLACGFPWHLFRNEILIFGFCFEMPFPMKSNGQVGIQIPSRYPVWFKSTELSSTHLSIRSGLGPVPDPNAVQAKSIYFPPKFCMIGRLRV